MSAEESFDLAAAELRGDGAELASSVAVLAAKLEQALPRLASVEWRKVGGFRSKRREVRRISVSLGEELFELSSERGELRCTRNKVVRGITLSRQELSMGAWIAELVSGVSRRAEIGDGERLALEGLLR